MGLLSKTQVEDLTDRVSALIKKDLAGHDAELAGATTKPSVWSIVDGSADPDVVSALSASAQGLDEMSLPSNYPTAVPFLLSRTPLRTFYAALASLVTSAAGGGYATLLAYLQAVSAKVHPLFAELVRQASNNDAAFSTGTDIDGVFAPNYQTRVPDKVYTGADGATVDDTTDSGSAATADVALFGTNGHALYIGCRYKFSQVVVALSTLASVTITPTFQYWNGSSWATLTVTDNATGFTKNDTIKFTPPADWVRSYKDAGGTALADQTPLFYIRIARTASALVTPPVGTCISLVPAAVAYGTGHFGVDQPPLAIVRITGVNTCVVDPIVSVDYARFIEPGLRLRALTPIGASLTFTLNYVNQAGATVSQAQGAWNSPAALDNVAVTLNGTDTGAQSTNVGCTIVTTATSGVFGIYAPELRTPAL